MTQAVNPYGAPKTAVADALEETQPVRLFAVSGRIGRLRYIAYGVGVYVLTMLAAVAVLLLAKPLAPIALGLAWLAILVLGLMLTIQRCHDFDTTGWLALLWFVPIANLVFWFIPGTDGPNRYGPRTPPNGAGVIVTALAVPIGIPVLGILAAIAVPAYQDYTYRAKIAEAMVSTTPWRMSVTEHYVDKHRLPGSVSDLNPASVPAPGSRYGSVDLGAEGVLTLTLSPEMGRLAQQTVLYRPVAAGDNLQWDCTGGTLPPRYRPASCRPK